MKNLIGTTVALLFLAPRLLVGSPPPGMKKAVLQILPGPPAGGISIDGEAFREAVERLLTRQGVRLVEANGADPVHTHHLRLEVLTSRSEDGIEWFAIRERCSLLQDLTLPGDEPGGQQRVWSSMHLMGQRGDGGIQEHLMLNLRRTLQDLFEQPLKQSADKPPRRVNAVQIWRSFSVDNWDVGEPEVNFAEVKVRRQPPAPAYPQAAKAAGIQGVVRVEITIAADGTPALAEALSGPPELQSTAIRYALGWAFEPARVNGIAKAVRFQLNMPFRLQ